MDARRVHVIVLKPSTLLILTPPVLVCQSALPPVDRFNASVGGKSFARFRIVGQCNWKLIMICVSTSIG
jgi:hypothetical protein